MVRLKNDQEDDKSHLATEICEIYQNAHYFRCNCLHKINNNGDHNSHPFIDWYLILKVGEDATIDTIRKQYLKLALLLHPDKNKHPKAEFAFKLLSQAYKCLSDDGRRNSFKMEKQRHICTKCHNTRTSNTQHKPKPKSQNSKSHKILQHLKMMKEQLREEVRVMERCIKLNRGSNNETPVFDPKMYANLGYPHYRREHHNQMYNYNNNNNGCRKSAGFNEHRRWSGRCETPVFELRTDSTSHSTAYVTS